VHGLRQGVQTGAGSGEAHEDPHRYSTDGRRGQATTDVFAVPGPKMSFFFIASVKKAITKRIFCVVIEIRVLKETSAIYFFKVDIPDHSITKIMSKQNEF
jgi:hypothetical protein